jgi:hypothetical protein
VTYEIKNAKLSAWVEEVAALTTPDSIYWCDGSKAEYNRLMADMVARGMATPLAKRPNSFLFRSDPSDVARVEDRTFISTQDKSDAGPTNNWVAVDELKKTMTELYKGCMRGRTMYVIPFSMGPIGSPMARLGIEITDSAYVVCNMHIMTRVGTKVIDALGADGSDTWPRYWPRAPAPVPALARRDTISTAHQGSSWQAGHRSSKMEDGRLRARLLLARPRQLPVVPSTGHPRGLLERLARIKP